MEPRHHDLEADELLEDGEVDETDDELGPDEDDTGYDEEIDGEEN